jgi:hypothetical protein
MPLLLLLLLLVVVMHLVMMLLMCLCLCRLHPHALLFCFRLRMTIQRSLARIICNSRRRIRRPCIPIRIIQHRHPQIRHRARRPPRASQPVEQHHALLQLLRGAVDVHFKPSGAEVAVHDAEGEREGVWDEGQRREEFGGLGVEEGDYACGG